jgi:hypothetical protein
MRLLALFVAGLVACASNGPFERGKRHYQLHEDEEARRELDAFSLRDCWREWDWRDPRCREATIMVCKSFLRSGKPGLAVASLETAVRHDPNDREASDLLKLARAGRDAALTGDKESWVIGAKTHVRLDMTPSASGAYEQYCALAISSTDTIYVVCYTGHIYRAVPQP